MVSALDPGDTAFRPESIRAEDHLALSFRDVEYADLPGAPEIGHVEAFLSFCGRIGPGAAVLIHCQAGLSRSPALAHLFLTARLGDPFEAARIVGSIRPQAFPNALIARLGGEILSNPEALF